MAPETTTLTSPTPPPEPPPRTGAPWLARLVPSTALVETAAEADALPHLLSHGLDIGECAQVVCAERRPDEGRCLQQDAHQRFVVEVGLRLLFK